jgi:hypothetical protein
MRLYEAVAYETGVSPEFIGFLRHKNNLDRGVEFETANQPTDSKWDYRHSKETPIAILVVIHMERIVSVCEVKGVKRQYPSAEERWDTIKEYDLRYIRSSLIGREISGWPSQRHSMARYRMPMFRRIEVEYTPAPQPLAEEVSSAIYEGAKRTVTVNAYERSPEARAACVAHYLEKDGVLRCQACHMSFSEQYGPIPRDCIHVHHTVPLHRIGASYRINPVVDLVPVCPNCHAVLHTADPPMTVEELAEIIRNT